MPSPSTSSSSLPHVPFRDNHLSLLVHTTHTAPRLPSSRLSRSYPYLPFKVPEVQTVWTSLSQDMP